MGINRFACFMVLLPVTAMANAADSEIDKISWLGGCWKSPKAEAGNVEHWLPLAGGTLFGVSRSVRQGLTVGYEFMQIREQANGRLAFIAQPSGQESTVFLLLRISETEVVFENPDHDFPQRIIYAIEGSELNARIEGLQDGELQVLSFPMSRVSCDSGNSPALP